MTISLCVGRFFFFFQAEDGIRDLTVTGVQTCALPISSRNGYFFVLDRTTGEHLLTMKFSDAANWAAGINANGQPERTPEKDNTIAGSLVSPDNGGATNWLPPSYDPRTGLFYVVLRELYSMYYLTSTDPRMMVGRSEEHTSELQSQSNLVCRLLLEKKNLHGRISIPQPIFPLLRE